MYLTRKNDSNIYLINCNEEKTCFREEKEMTLVGIELGIFRVRGERYPPRPS